MRHEPSQISDEPSLQIVIYGLASRVDLTQSLVVTQGDKPKHWWNAAREPIFAEWPRLRLGQGGWTLFVLSPICVRCYDRRMPRVVCFGRAGDE